MENCLIGTHDFEDEEKCLDKLESLLRWKDEEFPSIVFVESKGGWDFTYRLRDLLLNRVKGRLVKDHGWHVCLNNNLVFITESPASRFNTTNVTDFVTYLPAFMRTEKKDV